MGSYARSLSKHHNPLWIYPWRVTSPITAKAGSTAAMVLLLAGDTAATTPEGRRLVAALDLSAGEAFAAVARSDAGNAERRIALRKACIRAWLDQLAVARQACADLLVVPGAGLSPLALDWCASHPHRRAIELDYQSVSTKRALINQCAAPSVSSRIECAECDVSNESELTRALVASGWTPDTPSVWVAEGLAYYISHDALRNLVRTALSRSPDSRFILEFACPRDELSEGVRERTGAYLDRLASMLGGTRLHEVDIWALAHDARVRIERLLHAGEMEDALGWPRHFHAASDTTLRLALLAPQPG